jgi:hypothetical protein|tara:strand:+ start:235 stop:393 length:159 start_codon:yes stop_codon:yes gene_type:complete
MKSLILSAILGVTVLALSAMANPFNAADDGFPKEVLTTVDLCPLTDVTGRRN